MTSKKSLIVVHALSHPIANKWEPSVSPSGARLGFGYGTGFSALLTISQVGSGGR